MRKIVVAVVTFVFAMSLFSLAFAGEKVKQSGTIKSIDKGMVVFCPAGTKDEIKIKAEEADVKGFKAGDKVKIQYEKGETNVLNRMAPERKVTVPVGC